MAGPAELLASLVHGYDVTRPRITMRMRACCVDGYRRDSIRRFSGQGGVGHAAEDACHAKNRASPGCTVATPTRLRCHLAWQLCCFVSLSLSLPYRVCRRLCFLLGMHGCTPRQSRGGAACRTCLRRSRAFQAAAQPREAAQTCRVVMRFFLRCHLAPFTVATMRQVRRQGRVDGQGLGLCSIRASASSSLVMKAGAAQRAKISMAATPHCCCTVVRRKRAVGDGAASANTGAPRRSIRAASRRPRAPPGGAGE